MEEKPVLMKLGLTEKEAEAYLALLELGSASAGEIAKATGMHRADAYDALRRLIRKSFVAYVTEDGKKVFKPVDPSQMLLVVEEEKEKLELKKTELKDVLPRLLALSEAGKKRLKSR